MTAPGTPPTDDQMLAALQAVETQRARHARNATKRHAAPALQQPAPHAQVADASAGTVPEPPPDVVIHTRVGGVRVDPETGELIKIPDEHEIIDIREHPLVGVPFDGNQMLDTWFLLLAASKWRSVARITVPHVDAEGNTIHIPLGTGFLVGPGMLLSNSHVITSFFAHHAYADFDYIATPPDIDLPVCSHRLAPDVFLVVDELLDYTLVAVEPVATNGATLADRGWNPIGGSSDGMFPGDRVNIVQHPDGMTQQVALRDNQVVACESTEYLHYYADTKTHSSGSPVWDDRWNLVALHHASIARWTDDEGRILKTENGPRWDWHQETSHEVEWAANEGVGIHAIRSDLNARAAAMDPARLARLDSCFMAPDTLPLALLGAADPAPAPTPPTPEPPEPAPVDPTPDDPAHDDTPDATDMDAWAAFDD